MGNETLYYNGTVLTMEEPLYAGALLVRDGRIAAVGSERELSALCPEAGRVDLKGRTLLPAFIDAHSHLTAYASTLRLLPLQHVSGFTDLEKQLKDYCMREKLRPGEWVIGFGYDHNSFAEKRHPDKRILDRACPQNPVLISHASGHMGVMNTLALKELGVTAATPDPDGGVIGRMEGSREPSGYAEETAFIRLSAQMPQPSLDELCKGLEKAQQAYLSYGITTVQDGLTKPGEWALLSELARRDRFQVDTVSYVDERGHPALLEENRMYVGQYRNHLKIGGYKIFLDGSPQGRTAWMSAPYEQAADGYRGYPVCQDGEVEQLVRQACREGVQLLAHCNGDAAAEQYLRACERVRGEYPALPDIRPVMIHAQLLRRDQLPRLRRLSMLPSFFVAHVYYWGDVHLENFGRERAGYISPAASALRAGVRFTFHQDTPVLPPDMLTTLWCAVQRKTKGGRQLAESECLTPLQALRVVTINGAYQYFEEKEKGSLRPGKKADLVILDRNPLTVPKDELRAIQVTETIKEGVSVYRAG